MLCDRLRSLPACHFADAFRHHTNVKILGHHAKHFERTEYIQQLEFVKQNNGNRSYSFHLNHILRENPENPGQRRILLPNRENRSLTRIFGVLVTSFIDRRRGVLWRIVTTSVSTPMQIRRPAGALGTWL